MSNTNYTRQTMGGFIDRLALRKRLIMLSEFLEAFPEEACSSILDAGVTADKNYLSSNYLEKFYPCVHKIVALSNQPAQFLQDTYPGLSFKFGDVRQLPFANDSFDVVFSSAVIEHVGSDANQKEMLAECYRVAKKGVFLTTPNRWHPIEVHTLLPLIHWLPKMYHRQVLKLCKMNFYAQENNLNLLDTKKLTAYCNELGIKSFAINKIRSFGFISNLMLIIRKN